MLIVSEMKLGIIGLDTTHVTAFTALLNDVSSEYHVPGGEVIVAFPGGSKDMEMSIDRVEKFTEEMKDKFKVTIVNSVEAVAEQCDAIFIESVDGRVHLEQFKRIAPYGKPTFIDKPFTTSFKDAKEIFRLAEKYNTPVMSCSALRYSEGLTSAKNSIEKKDIYGVDCYGPLALEPTHGLFWYGIHTAEMLFSMLGTGCKSVKVIKNQSHEMINGKWKDGRIGTLRGNRINNNAFGALIHGHNTHIHVDVTRDQKPFYASLLEKVITFFQEKHSPIEKAETLEIIRFLEAANESRETDEVVYL